MEELILSLKEVDELIRLALREDMPEGDITTLSVLPQKVSGKAVIITESDGVLAGIPVAKRVFEILEQDVKFHPLYTDGQTMKKGDVVAEIEGDLRGILAGERIVLNFLQRLSGIATLTREYVQRVEGYNCVILDTRKTLPGWRVLDKYAVRVGGGRNHRLNLSDAVLIKDNHIHAYRHIVGKEIPLKELIQQVREKYPQVHFVEIEVHSLQDVESACQAGADTIMLDNMSIDELKEAVSIARRANPSVQLEASGGINLDNVQAVAATGVDFISVGELTHSVRALDMSMELVEVR